MSVTTSEAMYVYISLLVQCHVYIIASCIYYSRSESHFFPLTVIQFTTLTSLVPRHT